jgi:hypothetical protein
MMYVKYPLSLRNVEDLLAERGIDISHETVRHWWNRFAPLFASDIRRQRANRMRGSPVEVAPRRDVREGERRDALSVTRGRPQRRGARELRHKG